jgi:hypothetical protein
MPRSGNGHGRKPGKKRQQTKCLGLMTEGMAVHDEAAARRDANALLNLSSKSPAGAAGQKRSSPATAKAAASKYHRDKCTRLEDERDHAAKLMNAANARARLAEEREERAKALAAKRLVERNAARESERAWREELHENEEEMEGLASEHAVADLAVVGRERREKGLGNVGNGRQ